MAAAGAAVEQAPWHSKWAVKFPSAPADAGLTPPGLLKRVNERASSAQSGVDDTIVAKIAWNLVVQQGQALPMNLFMMWMSGSQVNLWSIMMTSYMCWGPIGSLLKMSEVECPVTWASQSKRSWLTAAGYSLRAAIQRWQGELPGVSLGVGLAFKQKVGHIDTDLDFTMQKVGYVAINLVGLFMAAYKLSSLGLLPTTDSDWLEFMDQAEPTEFSAGGFIH